MTEKSRVAPWQVAALIAGLAVLLALPFMVGSYLRYLIVIWMLYSISGMGLNLPIGQGKLYSLGHGGFMLIGAYTFGVAITKFNASVPGAMLLALALSIVAGLIVGLPALRLRLFSLAIVTFAFGHTLFHVVKAFEFTGGPQGIFLTSLWITNAGEGRVIYYVVLAVAVLSVILTSSIVHSKSGRALRMMGENEVVARSLGINLLFYKLAAFTFASVFGAMSGALHAAATGYVAPETYSAELSVLMFAAVMIGGKGRLFGPFLGAAFIVGIPELTQGTRGIAEIIYGLLFIIVVTLSPNGIVGAIDALFRHLRGNVAALRTSNADRRS